MGLERAHRREKPGEHEVVAEIARAVEVVAEVNPHRWRVGDV